jgi:hypothetical protein
MDDDGPVVTDAEVVIDEVSDKDGDGVTENDCTGPVYSSIKAVFADVYQ